MQCDPSELVAVSKCYCGFRESEYSAIAIYLLCQWAEEAIELIAAPCQLFITNGGGGTVILHWTNPITYTGIEIWHTTLLGGTRHLEITLPGNSTFWQTPILAPGDYFIVRGVAGDDVSGFAYPGPCV